MLRWAQGEPMYGENAELFKLGFLGAEHDLDTFTMYRYALEFPLGRKGEQLGALNTLWADKGNGQEQPLLYTVLHSYRYEPHVSAGFVPGFWSRRRATRLAKAWAEDLILTHWDVDPLILLGSAIE